MYINGSSGNDNNDGLSWETSKLTIKNATSSVVDHGVVNIADGEYTGTSNTNVVIDKNMQIIGQSREGTIINGANTTRLFIVMNGVNVTITNLTLVNGNEFMGGAILNNANLTVNNCDFINNTATNGGGAIYSNKDHPNVNLALTNCNFYNNSAHDGGAICSLQNGSDIILTITNCIFMNNSAKNGGGGAITAVGMSISGSLFDNNTASMGGAIQGVTTTSITDTTFINNTAQWAGGAIYNMPDSIHPNYPVILTVTCCEFINNTAHDGGAIQNLGTLIINNCNFTNNSANTYGGLGGAIFGNETIIKNSTFNNNSGNYGGAILNDGNLTVTECYFINNLGSFGGAIASKLQGMNNLTVNNSYFEYNNASEGGAILCDTLTLSNCSFYNNSAKNFGGAIHCQKDSMITESNFETNTSKHLGGAISYGEGNLTLTKCNFNNNSAVYSGGAITCTYMDTSHYLTIIECSFTNNSAEMYGGAVITDYLNISNSYFINNSAVNDGGCIISTNCTSVTNCSFINNSAGNYGGAICCRNDLNIQNSFMITNNSFINNTANYGGAIYGSNAEIHFNRFINNTAIFGNDIYTISSLTNADNNWWGSNTGPNGRVKGITVNKWIVLNIKSDPSIIKPGQNSTITADLLHDNGILKDPKHPELYYHNPANGHVPDETPVYFSTSIGTIESPVIMNNGIGISTLEIGSLTEGTATISALVDDQTIQIPVKVDSKSPIIVSVDPVNNTRVKQQNKLITVTFNESVKPGSFYDDISIIGPSGSVSFAKNINYNVLTLTPIFNYVDGSYILYIPVNAVNDLMDYGLAEEFRSNFIVDTITPIVVTVDPANNGSTNNPNKIIKVIFKEEIKNGTGWIELRTSTGKTVKFTTEIIGKVLSIKPLSKFMNGKYILLLHTGSLSDLAGNYIKPFSSAFTMDNKQPTVISTVPARNSYNIASNKLIRVYFSEPIKIGTGWIELINSSGKSISLTKTIIGNVLIINHSKLLSKGTNYTLVLHSGSVTDLAGNKQANFITKFRT
jgi:predicted outer membrane repeat protein